MADDQKQAEWPRIYKMWPTSGWSTTWDCNVCVLSRSNSRPLCVHIWPEWEFVWVGNMRGGGCRRWVRLIFFIAIVNQRKVRLYHWHIFEFSNLTTQIETIWATRGRVPLSKYKGNKYIIQWINLLLIFHSSHEFIWLLLSVYLKYYHFRT